MPVSDLDEGRPKGRASTQADVASKGDDRMKRSTDTDVKAIIAIIAFNAASVLDKKDRVASVKGLLQCDEEEARALISRGRRIAREKAKDGAHERI